MRLIIIFYFSKVGKVVVYKSELNFFYKLKKSITMKKILFSAVVLMGAVGICVSNFSSTNAQVPASKTTYILKDTTPTDTTKKDSAFLLK